MVSMHFKHKYLSKRFVRHRAKIATQRHPLQHLGEPPNEGEAATILNFSRISFRPFFADRRSMGIELSSQGEFGGAEDLSSTFSAWASGSKTIGSVGDGTKSFKPSSELGSGLFVDPKVAESLLSVPHESTNERARSTRLVPTFGDPEGLSVRDGVRRDTKFSAPTERKSARISSRDRFRNSSTDLAKSPFW